MSNEHETKKTGGKKLSKCFSFFCFLLFFPPRLWGLFEIFLSALEWSKQQKNSSLSSLYSFSAGFNTFRCFHFHFWHTAVINYLRRILPKSKRTRKKSLFSQFNYNNLSILNKFPEFFPHFGCILCSHISHSIQWYISQVCEKLKENPAKENMSYVCVCLLRANYVVQILSVLLRFGSVPILSQLPFAVHTAVLSTQANHL